MAIRVHDELKCWRCNNSILAKTGTLYCNIDTPDICTSREEGHYKMWKGEEFILAKITKATVKVTTTETEAVTKKRTRKKSISSQQTEMF